MLVDYDVPHIPPIGAVFLSIGDLVPSSDAQFQWRSPPLSFILSLPSDAPELSSVTSGSKNCMP